MSCLSQSITLEASGQLFQFLQLFFRIIYCILQKDLTPRVIPLLVSAPSSCRKGDSNSCPSDLKLGALTKWLASRENGSLRWCRGFSGEPREKGQYLDGRIMKFCHVSLKIETFLGPDMALAGAPSNGSCNGCFPHQIHLQSPWFFPLACLPSLIPLPSPPSHASFHK